MNFKEIGGALLFFGIGSIVLDLLNYEFMILAWIDNWGETTGWIIRGVMIAAGAVLLGMGMKQGQGETAQ